jgi:hypothetical protein
VFQNAAHNIIILNLVKKKDDQNSSFSGIDNIYNAYAILLLSAASTYGDRFKATKIKYHFMAQEIENSHVDHGEHIHDQFDEIWYIDCPVSSIRANVFFLINFTR